MTKEIAISIASDILSLFHFPLTATYQALFKEHLQKKAGQARDILLEEISDSDFSKIDEDDRLSVMHRYLLAASNGEARLNLRILAQLIRGLLNNKNLSSPLYASEFNRYSKILEGLSYEEIQILATLYKFKLQNDTEKNITGFQYSVSIVPADPSHYTDKAKRWLSGMPVAIKVAQGNVHENYGNKVMDSDDFEATLSALSRTGLVYQGNGDKKNYELSSLFYKIIELVDFQEALNKEDNSQ